MSGGELDRFLDRVLVFAGQAQDEGAVDFYAELVAVLGEAAGDVDQHALLDVVQDLLVAAFVADEEQAQAVVFQNLQRAAGDIGFGVAGPGDAQACRVLSRSLGARQVVRERVVVEEIFAHLREHLLALADFLGDVLRGCARGSGGRRRFAARGRRCSAICSRGRCRARCRGAAGSR